MAKYNQFKYGGGQNGAKYGLRFRLSQTLTIVWNLASAVFKTLTIKWNLYKQITNTLTLKWNVFKQLFQTLTLKWHTLNQYGLWSARTKPSDDGSASGRSKPPAGTYTERDQPF